MAAVLGLAFFRTQIEQIKLIYADFFSQTTYAFGIKIFYHTENC